MVGVKCPVCFKVVAPTRKGLVQAHYDGRGSVCPASGEPKHITQQEVRQ